MQQQKPAQAKPIALKPKPVTRVQQHAELVAPPRVFPPTPLPRQEVGRQPAPASPQAPAPKPQRPVRTNVFSGEMTPTLPKMAPSKVQTGGFGDPNGVPANPKAKGEANIASVGSFDLPVGPGYGNGTGGARGARGVIAGTQFANPVAAAPKPAAPPARVQATNFNPAPVEGKKKTLQQVKPAMLPVSIQEKPSPVYTAEARQLHVEGEVLLQVMFTATGQVRVLRVLHSLGHGLDEAAMRAAERIRFSPAQQEGRPVDSTATLHIVFQLS